MGVQISLGQMDVLLGKPDENYARMSAWVAEASRLGSDLILFPELWSTGYDLENWGKYATPVEDGLFGRLRGLAKQHHISLGGSLLERRGDQAFNTFVLIGSDGNLLGLYRKVHLFRLMDEEKWLAAGDELVVAEAVWGRTGLGICYDLRFPEMFRYYGLRGAELILIPAEWPSRRIQHWSTLLRARAIENQVFIAAVNRVGESKGEVFGGHSALINPWGEALAEGNEVDEALLTAEIDLKEVDRVRQHIPVFGDRRADVYGDLAGSS